MILSEATVADTKPLTTFLKAEVANVSPRITASLRDDIKKGTRRLVKLEEGGEIAAVIGVTSLHTEDGPGWLIEFLVVAHDHPDKVKALDTITLYACNLSASEGAHSIAGNATSNEFSYGRDLLGMTPYLQGTNVKTGKPSDTYWVRGNVKDMMEHILKRRPEWRL